MFEMLKSARPSHPSGADCWTAGWKPLLILLGVAGGSAGYVPAVHAHASPVPPSLASIQLPVVPGLMDGDNPIVVDRNWGILLGKALFWDMNVGSDGVACGSCHFSAGADARTRNQFAPNKSRLPANATDPNGFDPADSRGVNLSNYQLTAADFPLYFNPTKPDTANAVASAGSFSGKFVKVRTHGSGDDVCEPYTGDQLDQTFNVGGIHTRRVEPRNAPTFINSVLFDRNFWDGRANHEFNGVNPFGPRDPDAGVWVTDAGGEAHKERLALQNASLASLATGPGLNEIEMSCRGRTWPDVARKLLGRRALERQTVHPADSVLGGEHRNGGRGLKYSYKELIEKTFAPRFWSAGIRPDFGKPAYSNRGFSQMEANFSMFFGIAIQLYGETLISDRTRFDKSAIFHDGVNFQDSKGVMTKQELEGYTLFNDLHCILCHTGPLLSTATTRVTTFKDGHVVDRSMADRRLNTEFAPILVDTGFENNGSSPEQDDPGLAGNDDFGNPLSFSVQYVEFLTGNQAKVLDPLPLIKACDFNLAFTDFKADDLRDDPFTPPETSGCIGAKALKAKVPTEAAALAALGGNRSKLGLGVGTFKVPQLYNVELTGPYFHNGGAATLQQVIDQYMRTQPEGNGGNFTNHASSFILLPDAGLSQEKKDAIVAFLKTLTDPRVRNESAPFDHPSLVVADGHEGDMQSVVPDPRHPDRAKDRRVRIKAVGRKGRSARGLPPLQPFDQLLAK